MKDITLDNIKITVDSNDTGYNQVCNNLYEHNVRATNGLLKRPGKDINLYLKDESGKVVAVCFVKLGLTVCILMYFG